MISAYNSLSMEMVSHPINSFLFTSSNCPSLSPHFSLLCLTSLLLCLYGIPFGVYYNIHVLIRMTSKLIVAPMAFFKSLILMVVAAICCNIVFADPDLLQDVCVADLASAIKVNGYPCREPFTPEDFFFAGLAMPGIVNTSMGSVVTPASVQKIPGLNALGISMARIDYAPGGLNPPHIHPRASELAYVLEGELEMGFITTKDVLISKVMKTGEMFVFPKGLVHYQKNNQNLPAALLVAFNSQFPGTQPIVPTLFGATPPVPDYVLNKAFQIGVAEVQNIKSKFVKK